MVWKSTGDVLSSGAKLEMLGRSRPWWCRRRESNPDNHSVIGF